MLLPKDKKRLTKKQRKQEKKSNMCKIMAMAGVTPEKLSLAQIWLAASAPALTSQSDKDGFGYACITPEGKLFGERWRRPDEAFFKRAFSEKEKALFTALAGAIEEPEEGYNTFGDIGVPESAYAPMTPFTACVMHARMATCDRVLKNVHPFLAESGEHKIALIHNGVIRNPQEIGMPTSTCDSEAILTSYVGNGVDVDPAEIQAMADDLQGYYACGVLGVNAQNVPYMDIFKDTAARLIVARIKELDTVVFCTVLDIIEKTVEIASKWYETTFTIEWCYTVKPGHLMRFNAATGEVMGVYKFDSDRGTSGGSVTRFPGAGHGAGWGIDRHGYTGAAGATVADRNDADDAIESKVVKELLEREFIRQSKTS